MADVLKQFSRATAAWFRRVFGAPTPAQEGAWQAIREGRHTLVVAPTGSGKTLSAFLWALDELTTAARDGPAAFGPSIGSEERTSSPSSRLNRPCRVVYVSPLKALAVDVERNLRAPLAGIRAEAERAGEPVADVRVGVRTGDTPAEERRTFARRPPDILITTPESLFLILTSAARAGLSGVETVIVDEIHAVAGTKRGAHLALSLERLDALLPKPAQRIGLSATVRPVAEVARFLAGGRDVAVVAPPTPKQWDLSVVVPVPDLSDLGAEASPGEPERTTIWPHVEERVVDLIAAHRSTLVFANSRRLAERLTARVNEVWWERTGGEPPELGGGGLERRYQPNRDGPDDSEPVPQAHQRHAAHSRSIHGNQPSTESCDCAQTIAPTQSVAAQRLDDRRKEPDGVVQLSGPPAQIMGQAGQAAGVPTMLARAHHGSVSREQRLQIEDDLKAGRLRAVVATSSLELGIDMGAIDLVIQVEAPGSVASGLQRVGRAGHQVGATSRGVLFPKFLGDLVATAVVTQRMRAGEIEAVRVPANPVDVLAQQIVAMVAMDPWTVPEVLALARRAAPFSGLTADVLESVLDMLSGLYPSDEFAELRPRLVWDRASGTLTGRRGAQRLVVVSGGTIPDRGLFGVFLAGDGPGRRVGELDEEMVYESRVGDVFALGTSTWRIEKITHDRVLVTPAPGQVARLPFWHGETLGRPAELGRAVGAFVREIGETPDEAARARLAEAGLDAWAADNLLAYLRDERAATGHLPHDRQLVVERSRDELGDWRVVVLSPYGGQVHAPWALVAAERLRERFGVDVRAMSGDDGMVFRLPDTSWAADEPGRHPKVDKLAPRSPNPPESDPETELDATLSVFGPDRSGFGFDDALLEALFPDPEDVRDLVTAQLGGSALFASRFRECAGRALLLPKRRPGQRQALWQQRLRASQLLEVASAYPSFPIVLETVRECVNDVFDVPALEDLLRAVRSRAVSTVVVETPKPSPFAASLLFGYVGNFMYEPDAPLAERRAAALNLDPTLLAQLLGTADEVKLADLLDPDELTRAETEAQRLVSSRQARDPDELTDVLRELGPLTAAQLARRSIEPQAVPGWLAGLAAAGRVFALDGTSAIPPDRPDGDGDLTPTIRLTPPGSSNASQTRRLSTNRGAFDDIGRFEAIDPRSRWAAAEDAGRLRDALGVPVPSGLPPPFLAQVADPLGGLLARYARTHAPFTAEEAARWCGTSVAVVRDGLRGLVADGRLSEGELRPPGWKPVDAGPNESDPPVIPILSAGAKTPHDNDSQWNDRLREVPAAMPGGTGPEPAPTSIASDSPEQDRVSLGSIDMTVEAGSSSSQFCDPRMLALLRRRSAAALRRAVEPVTPSGYARFLPQWHEFGRRRGTDGVARTIEQLAGVPLPASAWETLILPSRVPDYRPAMLDELIAAGEVVWQGRGPIGTGDGWVSLHPTDLAPLTLAPADEPYGTLERQLLDALRIGGAQFLRSLAGIGRAGRPGGIGPSGGTDGLSGTTGEIRLGADTVDPTTGEVITESWAPTEYRFGGKVVPDGIRLGADTVDPTTGEVITESWAPTETELADALWRLVWAGLVTNDTFAPVRALLGRGKAAHRANRPAPARGRYGRRPRPTVALMTPPLAQTAGRWSALLRPDPAAATERAVLWSELLLDRYGVVTRGSVVAEELPGGFAAAYRVLAAAEDASRLRRGYFIEGLGAAQFAEAGVVDRLRGQSEASEPRRSATVLAACDPANPYGAALPWPPRASGQASPAPQSARETEHVRPLVPIGAPGRKAGAVVVEVDGALAVYLERGAHSLRCWPDDPDVLAAAATALAQAVHDGRLGSLKIERINGESVFASVHPLAPILTDAGFRLTPGGLRLRH